MKKMLLTVCLLFLFVLIGCSNHDEVAGPTKLSDSKVFQVKVEEVAPETLFNSLVNHSPMVPLGNMPIPENNPMKVEVLTLGRALFFDPRLSGNNQVSCQTCHDPNLGYGDGKATLTKLDGKDGRRNSPTIINTGYYKLNFWDGRAASLEEQALGPIQNPDEMNQSLDDLIKELKAVSGYEQLFSAAFEDGITEQNIAKALAAFQRQIVVKNTPYDRFMQGELDALNPQEIRGLSLFSGKAFCSFCHNGPNLTDNKFYNIGINNGDEGRFAVTGDKADLGRIRTPGLYGITHTGPYMHDGSINSLEEVIEYYDRGGDDHPNKSFIMNQFLNPISLSEQEKADLAAFLKVLGGEPPFFTKPKLP